MDAGKIWWFRGPPELNSVCPYRPENGSVNDLFSKFEVWSVGQVIVVGVGVSCRFSLVWGMEQKKKKLGSKNKERVNIYWKILKT